MCSLQRGTFGNIKQIKQISSPHSASLICLLIKYSTIQNKTKKYRYNLCLCARYVYGAKALPEPVFFLWTPLTAIWIKLTQEIGIIILKSIYSALNCLRNNFIDCIFTYISRLMDLVKWNVFCMVRTVHVTINLLLTLLYVYAELYRCMGFFAYSCTFHTDYAIYLVWEMVSQEMIAWGNKRSNLDWWRPLIRNKIINSHSAGD